ncbi:hypothetical protein MMC25_001015 [Agyrium rufum]|nr:hypothetical protein [Agyrium rufum]
MLLRYYTSLVFLASTAFADLKITTPSGVAVGPVIVTWAESNVQPLISSLAGCQVFLMAGGNNDANSEQLAAASTTASAKTVTLTIPPSGPSNAPNAYYIKIISAGTTSGQVENFSARFSIAGMQGAWAAPAAEADWKTISGTAGPATVNSVGQSDPAANPGAAPGAAQGSYGVPYLQQQGLTRYAPMQPKPGSTITATNTAPLIPPFAWSIATSFLPIPSIVTTSTQPVTYSASTSMENTASPVAQPSDDMAKFMARWKD